MPMDPFSFWLQASVFWARLFKQQHEAYLQMLGSVAAVVPHPTAAELAAQAQAQASPDAVPPSVTVPAAAKKAIKVAKPTATPKSATHIADPATA